MSLKWENTEGRTAGDGKTVTATAGNIYSKGSDSIQVVVEGGDSSTPGAHIATAVSLTGSGATNYKLPENAKKYLARIAELVDSELAIISVGPRRDQTFEV